MNRCGMVKSKVAPVVIGALCATTPKLKEWLQQILDTTSEVSVQKCAVLETADILHRTLNLPGVVLRLRNTHYFYLMKFQNLNHCQL